MLPDDIDDVLILQKRLPPPDDSALAARWIFNNRLTAFGLGDFRKYEKGIWNKVSRDQIRRDIIKILEAARPEGIRSSNGLLNSVTEIAKSMIAVDAEKWNAEPNFLPCKNGVLDIPTRTLLPHMPDIYATTQLPFDYDPDADCPAFKKALQQIPGATDFLQEFAGYSLTMDISHEIAIWLWGSPGSGKSTLLVGLQAMLGERSGILGLADIEQSRFALANLPGKTLVISSEQPDGFVRATHKLNEIISGEKITVEQKFKESIEITPRVKLIWAMNNIPRINDANNGLMRRVKIIEFPDLADNARDPELKERIKTEGAGILNWALEGLERLRTRKKFFIPDCVQGATDDFKKNNDIPKLFLEEIGAIYGVDKRIQSQELYNKYRDWCISTGHKPMSSTKMATEWKRLGFDKMKAAGVAYWQGIEIPSFFNNVP